jgi:hypothetical protein
MSSAAVPTGFTDSGTRYSSGYVVRGREEELAREYLDRASGFLLHAPARSGKSRFIRHVVEGPGSEYALARASLFVPARELEQASEPPWAQVATAIGIAGGLTTKLIDETLAQPGTGESRVGEVVERVLNRNAASGMSTVLVLERVDDWLALPAGSALMALIRGFLLNASNPFARGWDSLKIVISLQSIHTRVEPPSGLYGRDNVLPRLPLPDLNAQQIQLLSETMGHTLADTDARAIAEHVSGNPFLVERAVNALLRGGSIDDVAGERAWRHDTYAEVLESLEATLGFYALRPSVRSLLAKEPVAMPALTLLDRLGVLEVDGGGNQRVRYPLYDRFFRDKGYA